MKVGSELTGDLPENKNKCSFLCYKIKNYGRGFPGGSAVKNPPVMQETRVRSLGWEDPLEKEMATYSSILAWKIPGTEEPGGLQSMGSQYSQT